MRLARYFCTILLYMATNVHVTRTANESAANLMRRFSKRLQGSGVLMRARGQRFTERAESQFKKKERALKRIKRHKEVTRLKKLGKIL